MKRRYWNRTGAVLIVLGIASAIYFLSHGGQGCTSDTEGGAACHGQSLGLAISWGVSMAGIALLVVGFWLFSRQESRRYRDKQHHTGH